eukprot:scaffold57120_cov29-Tisochrysis_lutea.AAC.2
MSPLPRRLFLSIASDPAGRFPAFQPTLRPQQEPESQHIRSRGQMMVMAQVHAHTPKPCMAAKTDVASVYLGRSPKVLSATMALASPVLLRLFAMSMMLMRCYCACWRPRMTPSAPPPQLRSMEAREGGRHNIGHRDRDRASLWLLVAVGEDCAIGRTVWP